MDKTKFETKLKAQKLLELFKKSNRYITREEVATFLGMGDSDARKVVAELATKYPIISLSSGKGYKLAKSDKDLEEVIAAWREIDSRIKKLSQRKQGLIKFYDKMRYSDEE